MRFLSARCNYASTQDGAGFSAADAPIGHRLADVPEGRLSPTQLNIAYTFAVRYRKQLLAGGIDVALIAKPDPEAALTARVPGRCADCGGPIPAGGKFRWGQGQGTRLHAPECPETPRQPAPRPIRPSAPVESAECALCGDPVSDLDGYRLSYGWQHSDCGPAVERSQGRRALLDEMAQEDQDDGTYFDPLPLPARPAGRSARDILGPGGAIARKLPGYEHRASQLLGAEVIERGLSDGLHVIIEAGTGTGKSLMYSVPAIASGRKVLISTADKALQTQLTDKDLPFLQSVMPEPFTFALLKGRGNYVCKQRLDEIGGQLSEEMAFKSREAAAAYPALAGWLATTTTGDIETADVPVPPELRAEITVDSDSCLGERCPFKDSCHAEAAKRRARDAQVVVVNHALLLRDLELRYQSEGQVCVVPEVDVIVLDECFPAGTLIDGCPIESIRVGDYVSAPAIDGTIEQRRVNRIFRKAVGDTLIRLTAAGRSVICTPNHPILTPAGWVPAGLLSNGDMVQCSVASVGEGVGNEDHATHLRKLRIPGSHRQETGAREGEETRLGGLLTGVLQGHSFRPSCSGGEAALSDLWPEGDARYLPPMRAEFHHRGSQAAHELQTARPGLLLDGMRSGLYGSALGRSHGADQSARRLRSHEGEQPDGPRGCQGAVVGNAQGDRPSTDGARREWSRVDARSTAPIRCAWLGDRGRGDDRLRSRTTGSESGSSPLLLPDRHRRPDPSDRGRGGWQLTSLSEGAGEGCQERGGLAWARLDRVEILESAGDREFGGLCPGGTVYNLEVEGRHSYLANGFSAHNCHHLEDVATDAFGTEITAGRWRRIVGRLERLTTKHKGRQPDAAGNWQLRWEAAEAPLTGFLDALKTRFPRGSKALRLGDEVEGLSPAIRAMRHLHGEMRGGAPAWLADTDRAAWDKLTGQVDRIATDLEHAAAPDNDDLYVRYAELDRDRVALCVKPIAVADHIDARLFGPFTSVISTSATLATAGGRGADAGFAYWRDRVGLTDKHRVAELVVASPFDYAAQSALYLPLDHKAFDPRKARGDGEAAYFDRLAEECRRLVLASGGGAFLLFTSFKALDAVHGRIADELQGQGYPVLKQGDLPRPALVRAFKEQGDAVLFGVKSFWEGVDVQGDALRLVVIDKLPFVPPDDPIWSARCDVVNKAAGDEWAWFHRLAIPYAVLALKQGFGRLIRSTSDRGVVAILDGRLTGAAYGKRIVAALPPARPVRDLDQVRAVFGGRS